VGLARGPLMGLIAVGAGLMQLGYG